MRMMPLCAYVISTDRSTRISPSKRIIPNNFALSGLLPDDTMDRMDRWMIDEN